jgi:hypothetical protein
MKVVSKSRSWLANKEIVTYIHTHRPRNAGDAGLIYASELFRITCRSP